jgi:hypothetical protein
MEYGFGSVLSERSELIAMTSTQSEIRHLCGRAGRADLFDKLKHKTLAEAYDVLLDAMAAAKQAKQTKAPKPADLAALVDRVYGARNGVKQGEAIEPARAPVQAEPAADLADLANRVYGARQAGKAT